MFTGLIEATGTLLERAATAGGARLRIGSALAAELAPGDSLAVNGVCLTIVSAGTADAYADVGPETLRVTTLGTMPIGARLNLERPLRADARLGGHFVQGHVDAVGVILGRNPEADFDWLTIGFPPALAPYLVRKGSIAVDGISLTVADLGADRFDVMVIPYTIEHTNLREARVNDGVNLECDMVGKYVVRAMEVRL